MICWVFAIITLLAVLVATFVGDIRRAILALWVAALGIGAIYLTLGAELLAIIQWIVSTLVAISFIFFAVMFGEYGASPVRPAKRRIFGTALAIAVGVAFAVVIWLGSRGQPEIVVSTAEPGNDLLALGKVLTEDHLLALEILALTLLLVLVGGGVIARPEGQQDQEGPAT